MNIAYGIDRKLAEGEMLDAVKKARLLEFIKSLPEGFDTFVGDRGVQLSGGEKQRIAIARAILRNTEILILDEATSSLDSRTEKLIQEAVDEAIQGKTAIVIAHRLSTIKNAEKIVVLENGRNVEQGKYDELIAKKGKFYSFWIAQST